MLDIDFDRSIIELHAWRGIPFLIKRDDLISPFVNGNKAYKFYFLLSEDINHIVSHGGNQSNAMLALSYIAKHKKANFTYFTRPLPKTLACNLEGNIKVSLSNGMKLHFLDDMRKIPEYKNSVFIKQGGVTPLAKGGILKLADSILKLGLNKLCVFYSSGTGTSSFYLQSILKQYNIDVFTTNCVGSIEYLLKQFDTLSVNNKLRPIILPQNKKHHFAKPYKDIINIYKEWLNIGIEFDLLYDCIMWNAIESNLEILYKYDSHLFIHSGGVFSNKTQLKRYKFKGLF